MINVIIATVCAKHYVRSALPVLPKKGDSIMFTDDGELITVEVYYLEYHIDPHGHFENVHIYAEVDEI
jgi:hypothetical protein